MKLFVCIPMLLAAFFTPICNASSSDTSITVNYQISIIIFKHITDNGLTSESWTNINNYPQLNKSITPKFLPIEQSQLLLEANNLKRQKNYQILFNTAWIQPFPTSNKTLTFNLQGGKNYNNTFELTGTVAIQKDQFFNVSTNFILTEPSDSLDQVTTQAKYISNDTSAKFHHFQMLQSRRMRTDELNYFDHPLFGMLIKITTVAPS